MEGRLRLDLPKRNYSLDFTQHGYEIVSFVGRGQFGQAFRVRRLSDSTIWLAKQIDLTLLDERVRKLSLQEADLMKNLNHPYIVQCIESFVHDNAYLVIIMEFCEGGDLLLLLQKLKKYKCKLLKEAIENHINHDIYTNAYPTRKEKENFIKWSKTYTYIDNNTFNHTNQDSNSDDNTIKHQAYNVIHNNNNRLSLNPNISNDIINNQSISYKRDIAHNKICSNALNENKVCSHSNNTIMNKNNNMMNMNDNNNNNTMNMNDNNNLINHHTTHNNNPTEYLYNLPFVRIENAIHCDKENKSINHSRYKSRSKTATDFISYEHNHRTVNDHQNMIQVYIHQEQVIRWLQQLVSGLQYIHSKRILHRDLKPSNILLDKNHNMKIGDFGISRVVNTTYAMAQTAVGTPQYMSPEMCENKPYTYKSDIWALGCILYEICTLTNAFKGESILALVWKIAFKPIDPLPPIYSPDLYHIIQQMLKKDPRQRPSALELLNIPLLYTERSFLDEFQEENTLPIGSLINYEQLSKIHPRVNLFHSYKAFSSSEDIKPNFFNSIHHGGTNEIYKKHPKLTTDEHHRIYIKEAIYTNTTNNDIDHNVYVTEHHNALDYITNEHTLHIKTDDTTCFSGHPYIDTNPNNILLDDISCIYKDPKAEKWYNKFKCLSGIAKCLGRPNTAWNYLKYPKCNKIVDTPKSHNEKKVLIFKKTKRIKLKPKKGNIFKKLLSRCLLARRKVNSLSYERCKSHRLKYMSNDIPKSIINDHKNQYIKFKELNHENAINPSYETKRDYQLNEISQASIYYYRASNTFINPNNPFFQCDPSSNHNTIPLMIYKPTSMIEEYLGLIQNRIYVLQSIHQELYQKSVGNRVTAASFYMNKGSIDMKYNASNKCYQKLSHPSYNIYNDTHTNSTVCETFETFSSICTYNNEFMTWNTMIFDEMRIMIFFMYLFVFYTKIAPRECSLNTFSLYPMQYIVEYVLEYLLEYINEIHRINEDKKYDTCHLILFDMLKGFYQYAVQCIIFWISHLPVYTSKLIDFHKISKHACARFEEKRCMPSLYNKTHIEAIFGAYTTRTYICPMSIAYMLCSIIQLFNLDAHQDMDLNIMNIYTLYDAILESHKKTCISCRHIFIALRLHIYILAIRIFHPELLIR